RPLLVFVGVGWIDGRIGVGKKQLDLVVIEKFGIVVKVAIVEMQLEHRD
ncbi:hypothetical protein Tco_1331703, partial [Tanacetum coccineum]